MITVPVSFLSQSRFYGFYGTFFSKASGPEEVVAAVRRDLDFCLQALPFEPKTDADVVAYVEAVRNAFIDEFEYHRMAWGGDDVYELVVEELPSGLAFPFAIRWTRTPPGGDPRDEETLDNHVLISALIYDRDSKTLTVADGQHDAVRGTGARDLPAPANPDDNVDHSDSVDRSERGVGGHQQRTGDSEGDPAREGRRRSGRSSKFAYTSTDQIRINKGDDRG